MYSVHRHLHLLFPQLSWGIDTVSFTWTAAENSSGYVGTLNSIGRIMEFSKLAIGSWYELLIIPDLNRLHSMYVEKAVERYMCRFANLRFRAFIKVIKFETFDIQIQYKAFANENPSGSDAGEVAFWPYLLRRDEPGY